MNIAPSATERSEADKHIWGGGWGPLRIAKGGHPSPLLIELAHCRGLDGSDVGLDHESRGEPKGIAGAASARVAVGVDTAEKVAVVVIRRTLPPVRSRTR